MISYHRPYVSQCLLKCSCDFAVFLGRTHSWFRPNAADSDVEHGSGRTRLTGKLVGNHVLIGGLGAFFIRCLYYVGRCSPPPYERDMPILGPASVVPTRAHPIHSDGKRKCIGHSVTWRRLRLRIREDGGIGYDGIQLPPDQSVRPTQGLPATGDGCPVGKAPLTGALSRRASVARPHAHGAPMPR